MTMASRWPDVRFGDLYLEPSRNGLMRPKRIRGSGYKMVNMGELYTYDRISDQEMDRVPMNDSEIARFRLVNGDLLFARQSLVLEGTGKCSIFSNNHDEIVTFESHLIRTRLDQEQAHPSYFHYYFSSPQGRQKVLSIVMQVAAAGIRASELAELEVPLPPLQIQRMIAAILSAYDDLIENNKRRIKILDEMAQRVYREWFVDFRYPGHERAPLVDSELGPIPEGWAVAPLADLVKTQYGYTKSAVPNPVGPKFLRGMDMNKASFIDWSTVPYCPVSAEDHETYRLHTGDVLVIRMADPGKVGIVEVDIDAVFASYLIRLAPVDDRALPYFLFFFLTSERYQSFVAGASTGTTRKSLSAPGITAIELAVPPYHLQRAFDKQVRPLRDLLGRLLQANALLRKSRDFLLPRLISGEIDVENLDIAVQESAA